MNKLWLTVIAIFLLYSHSANNYTVKHHDGLSIKFSKVSPPLAIFEDEQLKPELIPSFHPVISAANIILKSGSFDFSKKALMQKNIFSATVAAAKTEIRTIQSVSLSGMTLKKDEASARANKTEKIKKENKAADPAETYVPDASKSPIAQFEDIKKHFLKEEFITGLNPVQKAIVERVKNFEEVLTADYSQPSFEEQATQILEKVQKEERIAKENKNAESVPAPRWNPFLNLGPVQKSPYKPAPKQPAYAKNEQTAAVTEAATPQDPSASILAAAEPAMLGDERQVLISGNLEMSEGLAYTGHDQILKVYRKIGGEVFEEGNVIVQEGRYEIFVRDPSEGILLAELKTIDQEILGRGELLLKEVIKSKKSREDLQNISIAIAPITKNTPIITIAGDTMGGDDRLDEVNYAINGFGDFGVTDKKGKSQIEVLSNSNMIVKANKRGYWGSMLFQTAGEKRQYTLFGDRTIESWFEQLNINPAGIKKNGIVMGDVKIAGVPVSEAEVELVSSDAAVQPTYFIGSILPDKSLNATTTSGRFAFLEVEPGIYLVRAKYKGKYFSPQVVVVDRGYVSNVTIQWQGKSPADIYVYDIETGRPVDSEMKFIGAERSAHSQNGIHTVNFSGKEGPQIIEASAAQGYFTSRATIDKNEKQFMIPMVPYEWIQKILARVRVNQNMDKSIVVGLAKKGGMSVEMDPVGYTSDSELIYFDQNGEPLLGAKAAPLGGGAVMINVEPGVRTLLITYEGIKQPQIQTVISEPESIGVFNPNY